MIVRVLTLPTPVRLCGAHGPMVIGAMNDAPLSLLREYGLALEQPSPAAERRRRKHKLIERTG